MGKTIAVILISIILLTSFVSCKNDPGCTIKFYANGGTGEMSDQTVGVNQTASLKANAFTKENCIFTGWNTEADGSGTAYADCEELTVTKSMDLYAQWAVKGVSITFDSNNGSSQTASQIVPLNRPTALRENTFTNGSLVFAGWNTKEDGSGTSYADGAQIEATQKMTLYAQWGIILTDDIVFLTGSIYILNSNVTWNDRVFVYNSNARLILHDGFTLTAEKGIHVPSGAILIIDADGEGTGCIVASSTDKAGIGGGGGGDKGGTIIINGGIINAESGTGAGIGGGIGTNGCHVTINNGTITATSDSGAGIGGGQSGNGGTLIINGGTITATSTFGAGIGGGGGGDGGTVTINNGTITATSTSGAGIGGGETGAGGQVTISGGTVEASSTSGAGIGGGSGGDGGTVTINNGIIIITSFSGAGIGGGDGGNGGSVTINGGRVNTTSDKSVGIGRGYYGTSDGALDLGTGVSLIVSDDNSNWSSYDGTRKHYMKTPL